VKPIAIHHGKKCDANSCGNLSAGDALVNDLFRPL
jgi:hypothetical protein